LFAVTAQIQPVPAKRQPLEHARAVLDTLSADEARSNYALVAREMVWQELAGIQIAARDYAGAEVSQRHFLDAAEDHAKLTPGSMTASRNLSLAYKYLGATIEMLHRRPEAIALYHKALALDEAAWPRSPGRRYGASTFRFLKDRSRRRGFRTAILRARAPGTSGRSLRGSSR
jgi:hypothetical protein